MRRFTTIDHIARWHLNISLLEYTIASSVYHLEHSKYSKVPGWCDKSQKYIAKFHGLTRTNVNKIIKKLSDAKVIEKHGNGLLRTSKKWEEAHNLTEEEVQYYLENPGCQTAPEQVPNGNKRVPNGTDTYIYNIKENSKEQISLDIWPTFQDFWDAGLSKQDKERSERYWKKLTQKEKEAVMAHIPKYLESNEKQFLRGAASYLFKKTWNNEIINRKTATGIVNRALTQAGTEQRIRGYFDED